MVSCPVCGNTTVAKINPAEGNTGFFISSINENINPPSIDPSTGFIAQLYGCTSCGFILLNNDKLKGQHITY